MSMRRRPFNTEETDQLLNDRNDHSNGTLNLQMSNGQNGHTRRLSNGSADEYDGMRNAQLSTLHFLCSKDPEEEPYMWDQVRQWFQDHTPDEITDATMLQGSYGITALHMVCRNDGPLDIVSTLLNAAPSALEMLDSHGWLPLHYAAANGSSDEMIKMLVETYPEAVDVGDKQSRVPLHFALSSHAEDLSIECAQALVSRVSASCKDESDLTAM